MRYYDSQVVEYTLKHKVPVKNGYQDSVVKKSMVPLDWGHPFSKDDKVTVVRQSDLELLQVSLKELREDKENLRKQLEVVSDQLEIIKNKNGSFWKK
jgi:hypothetical protein